MSTREETVTHTNLKWWATAIIIPGLGLLITVIVFGTQIVDELHGVKSDVQNIKEDLRGLHGSFDTLKNRQLQYHYENLIHQAKVDASKK